MEKLLLFCFIVFAGELSAQHAEGKVEISRIYSSLLENPGGENPERRVSVYLPPGYEESNQRYPVIYYLHGFTLSDSINMAWFNTPKILDLAINTGKIRPFIFVISDQYTSYRGSFYTNSSLTGKWADFTAKELVKYVDDKYRTLANKESRGITGWSMGGFGAIKLGMLYPEIFSTVYAFSPGVLGFAEEYGINGEAFRRVLEIENREELIRGYNDFEANVIVAAGRAFSPNSNNPPFYADLPYQYRDGKMVVDYEVLELWNKNMPTAMAEKYTDNLKKLTALKLDWGRNDENRHIPITCKKFSEKLENLGIDHYAEEYLGNHGNRLWGNNGRFLNDMLPFLDTHLKFE